MSEFGSAQVHIVLAVCRMFGIFRVSDNGSDWNQGFFVLTLFSVEIFYNWAFVNFIFVGIIYNQAQNSQKP